MTSKKQEFILQDLGFSCSMSPAVMNKSHSHNELELNYVLEGSFKYYIAGKRTVDLSEHQVAAFWGAVPHIAIDPHNNPQLIWMTIPVSWLIQWSIPTAFMHALFKGALWIEGPEYPPYFQKEQFQRWMRELSDSDPELRTIVSEEVRARLFRMARDFAKKTIVKSDGGEHGTSAVLALQIASLIDQSFLDRTNLHELLTGLGVHPVYATQNFKRFMGCTPLLYRTRLRMYYAQQLLLTTDKSMYAIARESGFGSESRFFETFKRHCGQTPSAYRKSNKGESWRNETERPT